MNASQTTNTVFREGGCYRDVYGIVRGPLSRFTWSDKEWSWVADPWRMYHPDGRGKTVAEDLIPLEVTVWRHPGLMDGEYEWHANKLLTIGRVCVVNANNPIAWAAWIDPPCVGKWVVSDGHKLATWEGGA